jgi:hypothetical protein
VQRYVQERFAGSGARANGRATTLAVAALKIILATAIAVSHRFLSAGNSFNSRILRW